MGVGNRIGEILREKGLSLRSLAEKTGISYNTLYSIIQRDSNRVSVETLQSICSVLDVPVSSLFNADTSVTAATKRIIDKGLELGEMLNELQNLPAGEKIPDVEEKKQKIKSLFKELEDASGEAAILTSFYQLNPKGREIAIARMIELTKISEYQKETLEEE